MSAGKHDSVMTVYLYSINAKVFDCKKDFDIYSGMIGSNAGCYADALLPTLR